MTGNVCPTMTVVFVIVTAALHPGYSMDCYILAKQQQENNKAKKIKSGVIATL